MYSLFKLKIKINPGKQFRKIQPLKKTARKPVTLNTFVFKLTKKLTAQKLYADFVLSENSFIQSRLRSSVEWTYRLSVTSTE